MASMLSCDSLLDEPMYSRKSEQNFPITEADALTAITGVYSLFAQYNYFSQYYEIVLETAGGSFVQPYPGGDMGSFVWKTNQSSNSYTSVLWQAHYKQINLCNQLLVQFPQMNISQDAKNSVIGEALFIRSMDYFNLVRMYGAVPLKIQETTGFADAYYPRSPESEVYAQIVKDLKEAASLLPVTQALKGRATKGAAYGLLAKAYLTMASMKKHSGNYYNRFDFVTDPQAYYDSARVYCQKVVDLKVYDLVSDYMKQFPIQCAIDGTVTPEGFENSVESIFEIQFSRDNRMTGNNLPMQLLPYSSGYGYNNGGWATLRSTRMGFKDFLRDHPGDYRMDVTFLGGATGDIPQYTNGVLRPDSFFVWPDTARAIMSQAQCWYPYIGKYQDYLATATNRHGSNFVYLRYADVLLMLAEAQNELGDQLNATKNLNKLMKRARNANGIQRLTPVDFPEDTPLDQDSLRQVIWKERRYELFAESHSWYDLIRTGEYFNYLARYKAEEETEMNMTPSMAIMQINERNILFPIPASEMLSNNKITENNPGF
jgi:hypothetical protein